MTEEPITTGSAPQPPEDADPASDGAGEHPEDNQHPALDPDLASLPADDVGTDTDAVQPRTDEQH